MLNQINIILKRGSNNSIAPFGDIFCVISERIEESKKEGKEGDFSAFFSGLLNYSTFFLFFGKLL